MTTPPRKARVWTVADFARHVFGCVGEPTPAQHLRARRMLARLDAKHGGALLLPRSATNCAHTLYPATLARLEPDLFAPVESLAFRIEELEEADDRLTEQVMALARQIATRGRPSAA